MTNTIDPLSEAPFDPAAPAALAECDLVLKGGITSGVVYPKLIARLSRNYRFRSIGGTSAGAIAAGACAAAELRRHSQGSSTAFDELASLPDQLGAPVGQPKASMLFHLFQPATPVRDHFAVLAGSLNAPSWIDALASALKSLLWKFWPITLLAVAVGLLLLAPAVHAFTALAWRDSATWAGVILFVWLSVSVLSIRSFGRTGVLFGLGLSSVATVWVAWRWALTPLQGATLLAIACAFVVFLTAAFAVALCCWRFIGTLLQGLHGNFYGLCIGRTAEPGIGAPGLTDWLAAYLNALAGMDPKDRPLLFGDLWGTPPTAGKIDFKAADIPARDRLVNLEVMTTAVSQRMCFAIPFRDTTGSAFYYDRAEWSQFFPDEVMRWLDCVATQPGADTMRDAKGVLLRRLPPNAALPVVVAVRMSLSFPVLLSAVPLYAPDFSMPNGSPERVKRVWFSDGGISSNLPLHFFDAPLPGHPTFAVNLKDEHPAHRIERDKRACEQDGRVYLPTDNLGGMQRYWSAPPDATPLGFGSFLWSIIDTMQNWRDEIQFPYPGYRDRIVQISQLPDEGGLNLNMPSRNIDALSDAGECAAEKLVARFRADPRVPHSDGWSNHEQLRLRTFLALAEELSRHPRVQDQHWNAVVEDLATSGVYSSPQRDLALDTLKTLRALGRRSAESGRTVASKAPRPQPTLRIAPRI